MTTREGSGEGHGVTTDIAPALAFGPPRLPSEAGGERLLKLFVFTIFKWRWLILAVFLAFTTAAGVGLFLKPPLRSATAKILLKGDRTTLQVSGLVGLSSRLPHSPQVLQSEIEVIKSREVMLPIATRLLGDDANLEVSLDPEQVERFARELRERTVAAPIPETNVIRVSHYAPTSDQALKVLRMILDQYMAIHALANSGSVKLLRFYEGEQERVAADLRAREESLRRWREETGVVSIDKEIETQLQMLADREGALHRTEAELQATRAKIAALQSQLATHPERLVLSQEHVRNPMITPLRMDLTTAEAALPEVQRSPLVVKLKGELVAAQVALQEVLQRYTDKDRRVQEKREQVEFLATEVAGAEREAETAARERIARLQKELAAAEAQSEVIGRETTALNPLREDLLKQLAAAEAGLTSLTSLRDTFERQVRTVTAALGTLREKKVEEDRLSRLIAVQTDGLVLYGKKLEEARIAAGLEREGLATLAVIEHPHAEPGTGFESIVLILALGAVVGLGSGLAVAFGLEFFNKTLRSAEDVEYYLGLPVLAAIPELGEGRLALPGNS